MACRAVSVQGSQSPRLPERLRPADFDAVRCFRLGTVTRLSPGFLSCWNIWWHDEMDRGLVWQQLYLFRGKVRASLTPSLTDKRDSKGCSGAWAMDRALTRVVCHSPHSVSSLTRRMVYLVAAGSRIISTLTNKPLSLFTAGTTPVWELPPLGFPHTWPQQAAKWRQAKEQSQAWSPRRRFATRLKRHRFAPATCRNRDMSRQSAGFAREKRHTPRRAGGLVPLAVSQT